MELVIFITFSIAIAYFFTAMYLLSQKPPTRATLSDLPSVAVLVAMRNEEESINLCLESLARQNYAREQYQVWVLNDRSTDNCGSIAKTFIEQQPNFHYKDILTDRDGLSGKMNVLAQALEIIDAEIILITDADCIVNEHWITTQVSYFDQDTGMVGGLTSLTPTNQLSETTASATVFSKIQTLDWLYLQMVAAGSSQAGKPITILGNNFGFRNCVYRDLGGFKQLGFSVTEDFKLMQAIDQKTNWKIRHTIDPDNTIYSKPVSTFNDFYLQRRRWFRGGRSARPFAYLLSGLSLAAHLAILIIFGAQIWSRLAALSLGLIIGMDFYILKHITRVIGQKKLLRWFIPFELYYIFNLILFSLSIWLPQKVRWKERLF